MSFLKRDEKKRLTAELIDELINRPSPMEEYDKFSKYDFMVMQILMIMIFMIIGNVRDPVSASLSFSGITTVIFLYTYFKSIKRQEAAIGKMFLDSTTYIGDSDTLEQIEVSSWELLVMPEEAISKDNLVYDKDDLLETLTALKTPGVQLGGGKITAPIIEELAKVKADKMIDEFKEREAEKKAERKWLGLKRKKPKRDVSKLEEDKKSLLEFVDSLELEAEDVEFEDVD